MCNSWYQVSYGAIEKTGYACGDYITLLKGYASCVENDDPLNIWIDTNKSSKITYVTYDKENPRTEVTITRLDEVTVLRDR